MLPKAPAAAASWVNGQFRLRITGEPGQRLRLEESDDLLHWSTLDSITLGDGPHDFVEPGASDSKFYRTLPF